MSSRSKVAIAASVVSMSFEAWFAICAAFSGVPCGRELAARQQANAEAERRAAEEQRELSEEMRGTAEDLRTAR
jgi:hypothetical protein